MIQILLFMLFLLTIFLFLLFYVHLITSTGSGSFHASNELVLKLNLLSVSILTTFSNNLIIFFELFLSLLLFLYCRLLCSLLLGK